MVVVIFEVWPHADKREDYLRHAASMRKLVESLDGFISVERFESLYEEGKILSLSFFESAATLDEWRRLPAHREMQKLGRAEMFANYRLRIAEVMRDYGMTERAQAPADSRALHG